jgi:hypothetical protein
VDEFLKELMHMDDSECKSLTLLTIEKLPMVFNSLSVQQISEILKGYVDSLEDGDKPDKLLHVLDGI